MELDALNLDVTHLPAGPVLRNGLGDAKGVDPEDMERRKVAHDFESLLLHQLFQTMRATIPESESEDCAADQVQSMYWSFLAQAVSDEGGIGLWKAVYDQMPKPAGGMPKPAGGTMDDDKGPAAPMNRPAAVSGGPEAGERMRLDERL